MPERASLLRVLACGISTACITTFASSAPGLAQETAVAPEKNPPGDIPDNQVFITYKSPQGF
jgi:hypothetical protein